MAVAHVHTSSHHESHVASIDSVGCRWKSRVFSALAFSGVGFSDIAQERCVSSASGGGGSYMYVMGVSRRVNPRNFWPSNARIAAASGGGCGAGDRKVVASARTQGRRVKQGFNARPMGITKEDRNQDTGTCRHAHPPNRLTHRHSGASDHIHRAAHSPALASDSRTAAALVEVT